MVIRKASNRGHRRRRYGKSTGIGDSSNKGGRDGMRGRGDTRATGGTSPSFIQSTSMFCLLRTRIPSNYVFTVVIITTVILWVHNVFNISIIIVKFLYFMHVLLITFITIEEELFRFILSQAKAILTLHCHIYVYEITFHLKDKINTEYICTYYTFTKLGWNSPCLD